jgi:hypothetical protein
MKEIVEFVLGYPLWVRVALIAATGAIVILLLFFRLPSTPTAQSPQPIFTLLSVSPTVSDESIEAFRLTVEVNGLRYSFPTKSVWAKIDDSGLPISFPIEQAAEYRVYFSGFIRAKDGSEDSFSPQPIDIVRMPSSSERRTYEVIPLTMSYEIRR